MEKLTEHELQRITHVLTEQQRRSNISNGIESLKNIIGLCDKKISKERILNEAFQYIHNLQTKQNDFLIEINKREAIIDELETRVSFLEKALSGELKGRGSYYYYLENILQKNVAMVEEVFCKLKEKLQENEELRKTCLLLEKRFQESEGVTVKNINNKLLENKVKLLENRLQDTESRFLEKETINEKLMLDVANLIDFNNTNQQVIAYLLSQLEMITSS